MIRGWLDARDLSARVRLTLVGPLAAHDLTFEIDTGFFGAVLLPEEWAGLMTQDFEASPQSIYLADGTARPTADCNLQVLWINGPQEVEAFTIGAAPVTAGAPPPAEPFARPTTLGRSGKPNGLIGRGLLANARLSISWIDGEVSITP